MRYFFSPHDARLLNLYEALPLAAELGMGIEIPFDLIEIVPELGDAERLRAEGKRLGVPFTVHLPFIDWNLASVLPKAHRAALERTLDGLAFAEAVGAEVAVLHTGTVPLRYPLLLERAWERLKEGLSALPKGGVPVAIENLALDERDLLQGPDDLARLLDAFPHLGFCLDFAHAFLEGGAERVRAYLDRLGDRLIHMHLNDTAGDADRHLPVGAGRIPYAELKPLKLPETLTFEVQGSKEALAASRARIESAWDI